MSAKGNQHEVVKTALLHRWYRRTPEGFLLTPETTFRLSADTYLEPNVVVYSRTSGLEALSAPTVLLVLEIANSSLRYDSTRKAALYTSFGVRELWVIDAVTRATRVFRKPSAEGYGETLDFGESDLLTPEFAPPEFALRLDELEVALGDTQKQVSQLPVRHCERSEAIQGPQYDRLGCWRRACCGPWIASSQGLLAMTDGSPLTRSLP